MQRYHAPSPQDHLFPEVFPNPLAVEFGEDDYGLFQTFALGGVKHTFRWCPPGEFLMGSPLDEKGRYEDEIQHNVILSSGFWIGETTVTQALWQHLMGDNPSHFVESQNPVEKVSWDDCQSFIESLNSCYPELIFALPTEAQWEYACRAGTESAFSFGNDISPEQANYSGKWDDYDINGKTGNVYAFAANSWGLLQMHGNVWEWCEDCFEVYTEGESLDPTGPTEIQVSEESKHEGRASRVLRGGFWYDSGRHLRSAFRNGIHPDIRYNDIGLRLALGH